MTTYWTPGDALMFHFETDDLDDLVGDVRDVDGVGVAHNLYVAGLAIEEGDREHAAQMLVKAAADLTSRSEHPELITDDAKIYQNGEITTPVFAHKASDGMAHVSFGVDFSVIDRLDGLDARGGSTIERVEGVFFDQEWADDLIDRLVTEREREDREWAAPEVGALTFDHVHGEIVSLDLAEPEGDLYAAVPEVSKA